MKKRKGSSLVMVLIIFCVVSILGLAATSLLVSNVTSARKLQERVRAYYLALSGIEMGTNAVLIPEIIDGIEQPGLLYRLSQNPTRSPLVHEEVLDEERKIKIIIQCVDPDGNNILGSIAADRIWIQITAVGTITNDLGETSQSGVLRILASNPTITRSEIQNPADVR